MKAQFEFTLPEEREEYEIFTKAVDNAIKVDEIYNKIRNFRKYSEEKSEDMEKLLEDIWQAVTQS